MIVVLPALAQLVLVLMLGQGLPFGSATSSFLGQDPSCATVEVDSAPAARSHSECAAVLLSITLVASTESCATDAELFLVVEEPPRDVKTYGGMNNSANLEGKEITWWLPEITEGSPLTMEFVIDLCDYCDKYGGQEFNPIDSFLYTDAEGNEPNERSDAFKMELPCDGLHGGAITSIVATPVPTPSPTNAPTPFPTKLPTLSPPKVPSPPPTYAPTPPLTKAPTPSLTKAPIPSPTKAPIHPPTKAPTPPPTKAPTPPPTKAPTPSPTKAPTPPPTKAPTQPPTKAPTLSPTKVPSPPPTYAPTPPLTKAPTPSPTKAPNPSPTKAPIQPPTKAPTPPPTKAPTASPTKAPTASPTKAPTPPLTKAPTPPPTKAPTRPPTKAPTPSPTKAPTPPPTKAPTPSPTKSPTLSPTKAPTPPPTKAPTPSPTKAPTASPTKAPTPSPTKAPTPSPTKAPTSSPTKAPTPSPTKAPTPSPTQAPTLSPTKAPTPPPTGAPTPSPITVPTLAPTTMAPSAAAMMLPEVSTQSPTLTPYGDSMAFSMSPTSTSTASPTWSTGDYSRGITLQIQSFFEARRRAQGVAQPGGERRSLAIVYQEDAEDYDLAMVDVCAAVVGVGKERVMSVSTDFGPEGPTINDSARRALQTTSSGTSSVSTSMTQAASATTASQLAPITTCEVDLSSGGNTRSMTAAALVDKLFMPENFVLLLDENRFGPVNAAVSSISFWQSECPNETCPAGDGPYASVFPLTETESHRTVMETLESDEGSLLGFIVLAVALLLLVCCSWLVFCLCCTGSRQKPRPQKPRQSIEDRYSVQNSSGSGPSPLSEEFSTSPSTSSGKRITPPRISTDRPAKDAVVEPSSPGEAQWRRMFGLSPAREPSYRSAPISPRFTNSDSSGSGIGSRTNSTRQGANPFFTTADDFKHRKRVVIRVDSVGGNSGGSGQSSSQSISRGSSQTISRGSSQTISRGSSQTISRGSSRTISRGSSRTISRGSSRTISRGSSQSISRSGSSGSSEVDAVALQPVVSPSSGSKTEEKRQLEVSDEVRSRELRVNDPFVREYASSVNGETKASRKSPREELNRLRETLNRPTKGAPQSLNSTSPTATMSSKSRSRSLSSGPKVGSLSGPIHEIHENDVEVDEGGKDSLQRNAGKQQSKALGGTVEEESGSRDTDRLESSNFGKASLNECNKTPPPSVVKRWRQPASPSGRSDLSTSTYGSNVSEATTIYNGQTRPPILSAGTAAVTAGIPSSTSRPGSIFVSRPGATSVNESEGARTPTNRPEATPEEEAVGAPRAGHSNPPDDAAPANVSSFRSSSNVGRVGGDKNGRRDSNGEPPSMPPLPPNVNQLAKKEVERRSRPATDAAVTAKAATLSGERSGSGLEEEHQVEEIRSAAVLTSPSRRATPLGGVLSNFACLAVDDEESPSAAEASGERRRGEKLTAHFSRTASTLPRSRAPGSRLPRIVDGDMKKDEDPLAQGELTVDAPSAFPPAAGKNCSVGVGSMSATGHQTLDKVLTIFRGRVITSELQPVAEGEDEDRVVTDSETESEISSRASSFSGVEGPRRASRDSALGRARQIAAIPPPSSGSLGLFVTPLEAVAEVPDEVKGRYSPHPPPYPDISESSQDGWLSGDRPKTSLALVIPSPSVRPTTSDRMTSESNATEGTKVLVGDGTGKTFKKVGECVASGPVENARPMMDGGGIKDQVVEEKGNSRGDSVKGKNSAAADDMPIVKKSTQKWAPQPSLSLPPPVKRPTEQVPDAEQSPGFSLISALSTFLWKKENVSRGSPSNAARVPGEHGVDVVAERDDEMGPDEGKMVSPSQSLKDWAESKVEAPPKHALDGGSSEVSVDTALGSKGQDGNTCEVADGQPSRWPHSDLPSLALDDGIMAGPADSPFSRATMNLQSPEPKPPTPPVASMPTLPKPPSSTFVKGVNLPPLARDVDVPSKSPGDSPKYDRDAIVKSMSLATREAEEYEESDIPTPRKEAWPSVRRAAARIESALGDASGNGSGKEHGGGGREEDEPCVGGGEGRANRVHGDTRRTSSSGNYYRYHDRK